MTSEKIIKQRTSEIENISHEISWKIKQIAPLISKFSVANKSISIKKDLVSIQLLPEHLGKLNSWMILGERSLLLDLKDIVSYDKNIEPIIKALESLERFEGVVGEQAEIICSILRLTKEIGKLLDKKHSCISWLKEVREWNGEKAA